MAKKTKKKAVKKTAKKPAKRKVARATVKTRKAVKKPVRKSSKRAKQSLAGMPGQLILQVDPGLVERLKALGSSMAKSLDQIVGQALGEFADTWEDHGRTVAALNTEDDRTVLSVRPDKTVQANNSNE